MSPAASRMRGFTLVEIASVLAIVATLAAVALPVYHQYVQRAQLSQLMLQVDAIATAVQIEDATGVKNLQQGATPGKAPPQLQVLPDATFAEPGGIRLLLIRAPAGFFPSSPAQARYGLVAEGRAEGDAARLRELYRVLPFAAGDKLWLAASQLAFPLIAPASSAVAPQAPSSGPAAQQARP